MGSGQRRTEDTKPQHLKAPGNRVLEQLLPPRGDLQEAPAGPAPESEFLGPVPSGEWHRGAKQAGYEVPGVGAETLPGICILSL